MFFVYKKWNSFCEKLKQKGMISVTASSINKNSDSFIVLKHDVETNVLKAYKMAKIEHQYGHCGVYYVQAYLMNEAKNIELLKKMKKMGHEISYHYDVMDSNKGNLDNAIIEFENNKSLFESNGFLISTVCQHGNPIIERTGYTSNRDFFRNPKVQMLYPSISDVMVNYKQIHETDYLYYSDSGRKFKLIYDPITNDVINSDDKNIPYNNLDELIKSFTSKGKYIISTHPHRWTNSSFLYILKLCFFKILRSLAKALVKIPFMRKIMGKYYFLAKKI